jgi:uncharacterized protein HemX
MAKKRKTAVKKAAKPAARTAAKPAAKKPAKAVAAKPAASGGGDVTVNALVIAVLIALVIGGLYLYLQRAKAEPAMIDITPAAVSLAPR